MAIFTPPLFEPCRIRAGLAGADSLNRAEVSETVFLKTMRDL